MIALVLGVALAFAPPPTGGIGASIEVAPGEISVKGLLFEAPARTAGLRIGDRITAVDGEPVPAELTVPDAQALLSGPLESPVRLTVRRGDDVLELTVGRMVVDPEKVSKHRCIEGDCVFGWGTQESIRGVVELSYFQAGKPSFVSSSVKDGVRRSGFVKPRFDPAIVEIDGSTTRYVRSLDTPIPVPMTKAEARCSTLKHLRAELGAVSLERRARDAVPVLLPGFEEAELRILPDALILAFEDHGAVYEGVRDDMAACLTGWVAATDAVEGPKRSTVFEDPDGTVFIMGVAQLDGSVQLAVRPKE
ncbi:MAG: PDZ domain-containing protein [Myxococcota bacterium]